jgi:acyl-coenzyme A synthetase/AMP-(fatty) acid ligase
VTDPVPARFNMARYCLADRPAERLGLIVAGEGEAERWSYGELRDAVLRVAHGLRAMGLRPGDRLLLRLGNEAACPLAFFGAIAAGIVALPTSAMLTEGEALFLLADSGARAMIVGEGLELARPPAGVSRIPAQTIRDLARAGTLLDFADTAADDPAFMVYTSGTTGRPKGVLHAQRSAWGRRPMYRGWEGLGPDDVVLHAGAFNWTYTLGVGLTDPWANGAVAAIHAGGRDPAVWPRLIERLGATIFATVPGLYRQILKHAGPTRAQLASLRHGLSAGEALPPATLFAWRETVGTELYEAFGMSEISTWISQAPPEPARPGTPGRPQPGRRVAVLAPDGPVEELPRGETGLLAVHRSDPGLMLGYWQRPEEEAAVWRGEWFTSGDLAHQDTAGFVWYHGRDDDLMNAGGYRVSPLEVEAALALHPAIAEVAVAEHRVSETASIVCAWVVPREGVPLARDEVLAWSEGRLAAYKRPKEVVFVPSLPRSPNGKLLRRLLDRRG